MDKGEIKTTVAKHEEVFIVTEQHTLADIARWLMTNPIDGETVRDMLNEMLDEQE